MSNTQTYFPQTPVHPGISLAEDLKFLSLSVSEAAERTGVSQKHLSNILNGKASITPEMALKLEKLTGTEAIFWNNLTRNYHASLAAIEEKKQILHELPKVESFRGVYRELTNKGIIAPKLTWTDKNKEGIVRNLLHFFSVNSLDYVADVYMKPAAAFRKYDQKVDQRSIAAIIRLGERKAQSVATEPFNKQALKASLPEIKSYSNLEPKEYLPLLDEKLRTLGIVLVRVPGFAHTGLQGAAKWLDSDKAMIIIKSAGQEEGKTITEDKFWFNLFHEIGHLLLHSKGEGFVDLEDATDSPVEVEANKFASKHLMPGFTLFDLNQYKKDGVIRAELAIPGLAKRFSIAPGIVAGMMSYEYQDKQGNIYKVLDSYKRRISDTNYQIS
jgi:HTH-type transcriptional regulator/antitoxin HigA